MKQGSKGIVETEKVAY